MTNKGISCKTLFRLLPKLNYLLAVGLLVRGLRIGMPIVFGALINVLTGFGEGRCGIVLPIVLVSGLAFGELVVVILGVVGEKLSIDSFAELNRSLKSRVWDAARRFPQLEYDRISVGEWERKLSYDVEMVTDAVRGLLDVSLNFAVTFLGTVLVILINRPVLMIAFLAVFGLNVLTHLMFRAKLARVSNLMRKQFYREGTTILSCIELQPLLRAFSLLDVFTCFFSRCVNRTRITVSHNWRVMADFRMLLQIEFWAVKACVLCGCLWAFLRGELSIGAVVSLTILVGQMIECVSDLMTMLPRLDMGYESSKALKEVLGRSENEHKDVGVHRGEPQSVGSSSIIEFDDVSFKYPGRHGNVIEGFSAFIGKNEYVCFLGRNGAGKSTLAKILLGQYEPTEGRVLRNQSVQVLIPQRITLFEGSVLENVRLMDKSVTRQSVMNVLELCGLKKLVEGLERGLDTPIKTEELSGGELQAFGIARALVRNPELIIADELSNNLDIVAKNRIFELLKKLRGRCTIVSITHDLTEMDFADRTFIFGSGKIEELSFKQDALRRLEAKS